MGLRHRSDIRDLGERVSFKQALQRVCAEFRRSRHRKPVQVKDEVYQTALPGRWDPAHRQMFAQTFLLRADQFLLYTFP
jgi:hypothetical protein